MKRASGQALAATVTVAMAAIALTSACASDGLQDSPFVQPSAEAERRWTVDINRVIDGIFRTYRPRCMDAVRSGHTVEFRNYMPEVPANVTSLAGPETLYSPTLRQPYNYIGPDDPDNHLCDSVAVDGSCDQRPQWSYWRATFVTPGVYDWIDTNSSAPGRKVVDPYYGTVTFVGIDPSSPFGTICVREADDSGCAGVCCTSDADCVGGTRCFRTDVDAVGRCLTPSG